MCVLCLSRPEEGVRSPGTGVTDRRELPYGCRELNLDPLEEPPALLTTEPSFPVPGGSSWVSAPCTAAWRSSAEHAVGRMSTHPQK
ncbi:mCG1026209, isoform CRA_a [Mus musculus]|nr:mCG1026209, isoform CRA_a [Mus musculus]